MTRKSAIAHLEHKVIGCKTFGASKADGVNLVALEMALEALEQSGQKKGEWGCDENGDWHCSVCKAIVERDEQINHYWQYCYHCGAEMENPK